MLEPCVNQAAGLQGLAAPQAPKLVALASHGQQQGELPMLWSLCTAWVASGLSVIVLDGHKAETDENPGLMHLLNNPMAPFTHLDSDTTEMSSWTVLPAALGFEQLKTTGFHADSAGNLFQNYAVVLLYAAAPALTMLLKGSGLAPLLVVAPLASASLSAYQALKVLHQQAHVLPTVANIQLLQTIDLRASKPVQKLQHCAMTFLGLDIKPISVSAVASAADSQDEMDRLALQLLERAVPLQRYPFLRTH